MRVSCGLLITFAMLAAFDIRAAQISIEFQPIEERLKEEGKVESVVAQVARCSEAREDLRIAGDTFPTIYPAGLFVVCDTVVSGGGAEATVLRYLFNISKREVLVASAIKVSLSKKLGVWRIKTWKISFFDYAP